MFTFSLNQIKPWLFSACILTIFAIPGHAQKTSAAKDKKIVFLCPPCDLDCDTIHFEKPGLCPHCAMKLYAAYEGVENADAYHGEFTDKKVAVLLFPGVEIIDFSGPWEVFAAAGMDVYSVASSTSVVATSMGLKLKPDYSYVDAPMPDILLVPGGNVNPADTAAVNWISRVDKKSKHTMSVCTGAFYLAAGGLLDNLTATTNYPAVEALQQFAPKSKIIANVRFVDNGHIITSAGLSSGIDAAFHLVSLYLGKAQTKKLANALEYDWRDENPFIRSKLADKHVQDFLNTFIPYEYKMTAYTGDENQWRVDLKVTTELDKADLVQLLDYQLEQVAGWKKPRKKELWNFEENGKKWMAELVIGDEGSDSSSITLKVKRL